MSIRKNDRIEARYKDEIVTGFATRVAPARITMVLDDGTRQLSGPPALFSKSDKPIPAESPFAKPRPKKGDRVMFQHEGREVHGRVLRTGLTCVVRADGGRYEFEVPGHALSPSMKQTFADAPSKMDRWAVSSYKPAQHLSEETLAFTAVVTFDGKPALHARNDGRGGCNLYVSVSSETAHLRHQIHEDAREWAIQFGASDPFEPADTWLNWAATLKPLGILAGEHIEELEREIAEMSTSRLAG